MEILMRKTKRKNIIEVEKETKVGDYILEKGDKIRVLNESMMREAFIFKAQDGQWYYFIAHREYGEYPNGSFYGPFGSEEQAEQHMDDNHSNPGGYGVDDSGKSRVPTNPISPSRSRGYTGRFVPGRRGMF